MKAGSGHGLWEMLHEQSVCLAAHDKCAGPGAGGAALGPPHSHKLHGGLFTLKNLEVGGVD